MIKEQRFPEYDYETSLHKNSYGHDAASLLSIVSRSLFVVFPCVSVDIYMSLLSFCVLVILLFYIRRLCLSASLRFVSLCILLCYFFSLQCYCMYLCFFLCLCCVFSCPSDTFSVSFCRFESLHCPFSVMFCLVVVISVLCCVSLSSSYSSLWLLLLCFLCSSFSGHFLHY